MHIKNKILKIKDLCPKKALVLSVVFVLILSLIPAGLAFAGVGWTDGFESDSGLSNWSTSSWAGVNTLGHDSTWSAKANYTGSDSMISENIDLTGYDSAVLEFWFYKTGITSEDQITVSTYNGSAYNEIADLYNEGNNGEWVHFVSFVSADSCNISYFRIRYDATLNGSQTIHIDDVSVTAPAETTWPQFQLDKIHTGCTSIAGPNTSTVTAAWNSYLNCFDTGFGCCGIDSVPVTAGGMVFTVAANGTVFAHDALNGQERWKQELGGGTGYFKFELATPAYADGVLYVALSNGNIYALDAANGDVIWHENAVNNSSAQVNTPVVYDEDGYIYFGTWNGKTYYCLDADNGSTVWTYTNGTTGYYWAGACIIENYAVFGGEDGKLHSVAKNSSGAATTTDTYTTDLSSDIRSTVTWNGTHVFVTDNGGYFYAVEFDESNGTFGTANWSLELNDGLQSTCTPAIYDGMAYVGTGGVWTGTGKLHCINLEDEDIEWDFPDSGSIGPVQSSAVISVDEGVPYIYFTTNESTGTVYCIDEDGDDVWSYEPNENNEQSGSGYKAYILQGVSIIEGKVYVGNDGGYLYCIEDN